MLRANKGSGNNEDRDLWQTPKILFDNLNKQYNFTFDCCANEENTKCELFSSNFKEWADIELLNKICWINPPFSKSKEMFEHFFKVITKGVAIFRCDNMETKVWQDIILKNANWIFIPKGRVNYEGFIGKSSVFGSALIGFNVKPPIGLEGIVLYLRV